MIVKFALTFQPLKDDILADDCSGFYHDLSFTGISDYHRTFNLDIIFEQNVALDGQ